MSKTKRIISFLLAVVMLFSVTSVGVNAYYSAYKDSAIIDKYNAVDQPELTAQQYASMALDEVDRMLAKENPIIPIEAGPISYTLDFSSIDKAFDSIKGIWGVASSVISSCGDLKNLNVSAIAGDGAPRRAGATSSDLDVIKAIVKFLGDNSGIIKKAVIKSGSSDALSLGLIDNFYKLDLDVPNMIKGIVYKMAYDVKAPKVVNESMDDMLQVLLDKYLVGKLDPDTGEYTGLLPELAGVIDIDETSFYDLLDKAFRLLFNDRVNELLDTKVRKWVKSSVADDPSLALLINTDYVVPTIDFNSWGNGETLFDHFNDILGDFFMALAKPNLGLSWDYSRGNDGLFDNLVHAAKKVFGETGGAFFLDYIEVLDPASFPDTAEGNEQFLAYVARSLINAFIDYVNVPNTLTTLVEVANYTLRELAGDYIPSQYNNYAEMDLTDIDTAYEIGADFAVYFLSQTMDMGLDYEDDFNGTLNAIVNWGVNHYGGLVASSSGRGWARINSVIFQVLNSSWLPLKANGQPRNDLESIIKDDIIGNLINLNLKGVLDLFAKNPTGELNQSVTYILVSLFKNIINMVFGAGTATQYANFETMITADKASDPLPTLVQNLINNLYSRTAGTLLPALLPIVCSVLDLSSPQEFEYPYISLGDFIRPSATRFYIHNESSGINTAATDAEYDLHQDQLYKYRVRSITTNQSGVTVKYNGSAVSNLNINGGDSAYFDITGSFTNNSLLILTIKYDILGEDGGAVTSAPIEQKIYTYVSNSTDDSDTIVNVDVLPDDSNGSTLPNRHKGSYYKATYINSYVDSDDKTPAATKNKKIRDLLDVEFTLKRKGTDDEETHLKAATITRGTNTAVNATLAANGVSAATFGTNNEIKTTKDGGNWNVKPYAVADGATLPADGVYNSNFYYVCSPTTSNTSSTETLQFAHYVVIYNNANLPSIVNSAVKANRQASNYDQTNKVYTYEVEVDGEVETMTTTGPQAWEDYTNALNEAIARVYAPKQYNNFYGAAYRDGYASMAANLQEAITALEACVKQGSGGVSALKEAVDAVVPTNINYDYEPEIDPETGDETYTYYKFYEDEYQFFSMCDFVPYTYLRFRNEKRAADKLINSKDTVDAVKLAYTAHRFNLYADRLLRVPAYNDALIAVVDEFGGITDRGSYSQKSWDRYVTARDFAAQVAEIPLDDQDYPILPLEGEEGYNSGLRQSMVNKARGELILAYKMLVENADYTLLNNAIANAATILDSAQANYTAASWTAFQNAKNAALSLSRELAKTVDNQNLIERLATALNNAVANLKLKAIYTAFNTIMAQAAAYTDSSLYTEDSWNDFQDALTAAQALNLDLDQSQQALIDGIVSNLSQAINALVYLAKAGIEAIVGATDMGTTLKIIGADSVYDVFGEVSEETYGFIFGFDYWNPTVEDLIQTTAGATYEALENDGGMFSTGSEINVYDSNGELVATYYAVLFGDIDGSGFIDDDDRALLEDAIGYVPEWTQGYTADSPNYLACDLNFDNWVDDNDMPIFDDAAFELEDQSYNIPE